MKWSRLLHGISALSGIWGVFDLIGAWVAGDSGIFLGMNQNHLYNDAQTLLLVSIAFGIGTIIHQRTEKHL